MDNKSEKEIDGYFMNMALEEAKLAYNEGEVPIGAIMVERCAGTYDNKSNNFRIISKNHNRVETLHDASAHAELLTLRQAGSKLDNWRLNNCTLYSTLEPCPMCLSAALAFRTDRVVYGAKDYRLGAVESYMNLMEYKHPYHHGKMDVVGGVGEKECSQLLVDFFRQRRKKSKVK